MDESEWSSLASSRSSCRWADGSAWRSAWLADRSAMPGRQEGLDDPRPGRGRWRVRGPLRPGQVAAETRSRPHAPRARPARSAGPRAKGGTAGDGTRYVSRSPRVPLLPWPFPKAPGGWAAWRARRGRPAAESSSHRPARRASAGRVAVASPGSRSSRFRVQTRSLEREATDERELHRVRAGGCCWSARPLAIRRRGGWTLAPLPYRLDRRERSRTDPEPPHYRNWNAGISTPATPLND